MADAQAVTQDQSDSSMIQHCVQITNAILRAMNAAISAPLKLNMPDRPLPLYRDMAARHRAGAVGVLLGAAKTPALRQMGASLQQIAAGSPLANVAFADAGPVAHAALAEIHSSRQVLIDDIRIHSERVNPRRLVLDATNLLQLGDIDGAKAKLAALAGAEQKFRQFVEMRILDAEGFIAEAERLAVQIRRTSPDMLPPHTGFATEYRRVGRLSLSPPGADELTPASMNAYLRYLILNGKQAGAAEFVAQHLELIGKSAPLTNRAAAVVLANVGHDSDTWRIIRAKAEELPLAARVNFMNVTADMTPERLTALLSEAATVTEDFNCTTWVALVSRSYALAEPVPSGTPEADATTRALVALQSLDDGGIRRPLAIYAKTIGYSPADETADLDIFRARALANAPADLAPNLARQVLTPRAAEFLSRARQSGRGLVLLSVHGVQFGRGNYLPAAAAALTGFHVKSVAAFNGLEPEQRSNDYIRSLDHSGATIEVANQKDGRVAEDTVALMEHLDAGGAVDVALDVTYTVGQKVAAPWLLRPMPFSIYTAQLAISRDAMVAFASVAPGADGQLIIDLKDVPLPPAGAALPVRAAWLTQRLARTIRGVLADSGVPVSLNTFIEGGGRPAGRKLSPLAEWGTVPFVQTSLCGWLAHLPSVPDAAAFVSAQGETSFQTLRQRALSAAAMLLHFQGEKPAHSGPVRRFMQQHRVLTILPNGEAVLAISLGALATGSLLAVSSDDLAPAVLAARVRAFKPDLIISSAGTWSTVLAANASLNAYSVLLMDDAGDGVGVEDLTQSFPPAKALPEMTPGQPAFVVFTSGSDGEQKSVVAANTLLSNGSGLDQLAPLKLGDRIAYLTRWDAIGLPDILACLRGAATVLMSPVELVREPEGFVAWLKQEAATTLSMPASLWASLISSTGWRAGPPKLGAAVLWGERIEMATVRQLAATLPNTSIFTTFGASEASYIGFGPLDPDLNIDAGHASFSPGGRTVPGVQISFAPPEPNADPYNDDILHPLLEITSADTMIGYFANLAAENAVILPSDTRSVRLADHVKVSDRDEIEVFGRADSLIKIGGRRVSLLEIEAAAEAVSGVRRAVAFTMHDGARNRIAIALESSTQDPASLQQLVGDAIVAAIFPGARPARTAILTAFPAGQSGKVDRAQIRAAIDRVGDGLASAAQTPVAQINVPPASATRPFLDILRDWAIYNGMATASRFNADGRPPEFDSIDIMDLLLLGEEATGKSCSANVFGGNGPATWRALARALAPGA